MSALDLSTLALRVDGEGGIRTLDRYTKSATAADRASQMLDKAVSQMTVVFGALGVALAGVSFGKIVSDAQTFEKQLALVRTVMDESTASVVVFRKELLDLFRSLPVGSLQELSAGLYDIVSAGIPAGDAIAYLGVAARAAIAGVTSTATAVDALTTVTNAWRLQNVTAQQASDQLFMAVNKGKITFEQLASAIGIIAPVAAGYNLKLNDVLGATAQLTLSGLTASEALTGIRSAIVNIINPTGKLAEQFPSLAKEFNAAKLETLGFTQFLIEFNRAAGGSKDAINALFTDVQGKTAVFSLLSDGGRAAAEQVKSVGDASGATKDAFDKVAATSAAASQLLRNQFSAALVELGDKALPLVNRAMGALTSALAFLRENGPAIAAVITAMATGWALFAANAARAATWTAILAATQTVQAFIQLARTIRSAADAMALFQLAGGGAVKATIAIAALVAGFAAYKVATAAIAAETKKFNDELERTAKAKGVSLPGGVTAPNVTPTAPAIAGLRDVSREATRAAEELADALEKTAFSGGLARQNALENAVALRQFVEPVKLSYGEVQKLIQAQERAAGAAKAQANAVRLGIADTAEYKAEVMTATQVEDLRARGLKLTVEQLNRLKQANLDIARANQANSPAKPIRELDSALVSVSGTLRDLSQALNGTGNDAVKMLGVLASALDGLAKAQQRAKEMAKSGQTLSGSQKVAAGVGGAVGAFGSGFAVGSTTTSRAVGALGGAAAGAATGAASGTAIAPGIGTLIGGVVGGLIGGIGGLLGASKNATQQLIAQRAAQEQLSQALVALRASVGNNALAGALAQAAAQFSQLRQQTEAAFSGRRNESERNRVLAELNALEAQRLQQIRDEFTETQRRLQQDFAVRTMRAEGFTAEAEALAFAQQQERELADLRKSGADAATLAAAEETLLAEARQRQAERAEADRRSIFDLTNGARAFSDPRGAADAAFAEAQQRRYADAVARGASAAELAAIEFFNLAEAVDRAAQIAEQDRRTREGLTVRGFAALGLTREAEDAALAAGQRQEMADAIREGMSPSNLALLQFVQFAEREQAALRRVIEDGTKAIQEAAAQQIAALDAQIAAEEARAAEEVATLNAQITAIRDAATVATTAIDAEISGLQAALDAQLTAIDAQREAVNALLQVQRAALQTAESQLTVARSAFGALTEFGRSLLVSEAAGSSPLDRLAAASARFDELRALAAGGDAGAAQALPEAARTLLDASKVVNASGSGFQRDFARVQEAVATLGRQFGGETDRLTAQVESLRQLVASSEAQVATLETLRDTLRDSTGAQIAALREQKKAIEDAAAAQIDKLELSKEAIQFASDVIVEALRSQKEQVQRDAERQIAELIKVQTEAFTARVQASDYYRAWLEATEVQGEATAEYQDTSAALLARMDERAAEANIELQAQTASLKQLVTSQAQQIVTLQAQIRTTVEIGQATVSELAQLREQVAQGNTLTRRAAEGATL